MDSSKLVLTEAVLPPSPLAKLECVKMEGFSEEKKEQIAKDFESVLVSRLLNEMKGAIGEWGFEEDGVSAQVEGMFWLYLAGEVANNGGFGLWKDIYDFLTDVEQANITTLSLDKSL